MKIFSRFSRDFADFLVTLGEGDLPSFPQIGPNYIKILQQHIFPSDSAADFIEWCYPNLHDPSVQHDFSHSAILAPNKHSDDPTQAILLPVEYLHTVIASGLPLISLN